MKILMHVNFLEAAMPLDEIFRRCAEAGYDGIEIRDRDRSGRKPLDEYLPWTAELARSSGLEVVYGSRNDTTNPDEIETEWERFSRVVAHAASLNSPLVNVFTGPLYPKDLPPGRFDLAGSAVADDAQRQRDVDYLTRAGELADTHNIDLCLETHNGHLHDIAAPTVALIDRVGCPRVQVNLDLGNIALNKSAAPLPQEIDVIGPRTGYVHLKNLREVRFTPTPGYFLCPLAEGDLNHYILLPRILRWLRRPVICIENTMPGDKRTILADDLNYLRRLLRDLQDDGLMPSQFENAGASATT